MAFRVQRGFRAGVPGPVLNDLYVQPLAISSDATWCRRSWNRTPSGNPAAFGRAERIGSGERSTAHPIAQVEHPAALNHHVRILQQVLRVDRPEVALAGPEHDGDDVHAHLVDQTRGKRLATDVAGG